MKRSELTKRLVEADTGSVWAFTPASFGALLGKPDPNYIKCTRAGILPKSNPVEADLTET